MEKNPLKRRKLEHGNINYSLDYMSNINNLRNEVKQMRMKLKSRKTLYIDHIIQKGLRENHMTDWDIQDHVEYIRLFASIITECDEITKMHIFVSMNFEKLVTDQVPPETVQNILTEIMHHYHQSKITPGENVGVIAAQSLSEQFTQSTLNTFHMAGVKKSCVAGIEQINAILGAVQKQSAPYVSGIFSQTGGELLVQKYLNDICITGSIKYDPSHENYSPWVLEFILLHEKYIPRIQYWNKLRSYDHVEYDHNRLQIFFNTNTTLSKTKQHFFEIYEKKIIIGVEGAIEYDFEMGHLIFDNHHHAYIPYEHIYNLCDQHEIKDLSCNDMHAIYEQFGIEGARTFMEKELLRILDIQGIHIDARHVKLIIDNMTSTGMITPNTYAGVKTDDSVILKATFERGTRTFANASALGLVDKLNDSSSQLLFGRVPFVGTAFAHVVKKPIEKAQEILSTSPFVEMYSPKYEEEDDDNQSVTFDEWLEKENDKDEVIEPDLGF